MYVSQIIMLYTLNVYRAVCQLYLNKTERKERKREREERKEGRKERKKEGRREGGKTEGRDGGGRKEVTKKKKEVLNRDTSGMYRYMASDLLTWVL